MEAILMTNPWVKHAQVFVDNQNCLNITVVQRVPQIRVFERTGNSYYIDTAQDILPLSDNYNHYELLFVNVPTITNDSLGESLKSKMLSIAKNIKSNKFWNAQTAQVVVNNSQDFQLITILGNQKILLGDTNDLDNKLENLLVFYQKIQNKIGWDKYEVLDARFQNQIVASPSLPWNVPIDRALTNMNWVKTIVGDIPIQEAPSAFPLSTDASAVLDKVPVKQQVKIDSQANKNNRKPL
jgi:cell division protein FtsQ